MNNNQVNRAGKVASQMDRRFPCLANAAVRSKRVFRHRRVAAIYKELALRHLFTTSGRIFPNNSYIRTNVSSYRISYHYHDKK